MQQQLTPIQIIAQNDRARLLLDIEFLDCLADPNYLPTLITGSPPPLQQPTFLNYLDYLSYLRRPEYVRFVKFPHSLYILEQLQTPQFRTVLFQRGFDVNYLAMLSEQLENMVAYQHTNEVHNAQAAIAAAKEQKEQTNNILKESSNDNNQQQSHQQQQHDGGNNAPRGS